MYWGNHCNCICLTRSVGCWRLGRGDCLTLGWDVQWNMADIKESTASVTFISCPGYCWLFQSTVCKVFVWRKNLYLQRKPQLTKYLLGFFFFSRLPTQNILIAQLSKSVSVFSSFFLFFLIKLNPNMVITIMPVWFPSLCRWTSLCYTSSQSSEIY